jgi:hypothetical protein
MFAFPAALRMVSPSSTWTACPFILQLIIFSSYPLGPNHCVELAVLEALAALYAL